MQNIVTYLVKNMFDLALVIVGLVALLIYKLQNRDTMRNAASLIILQIDELFDRVLQIQSYITDQGLNSKAFYESLPLMYENYWEKYKHLFVRKIDSKSYDRINLFYQYVSALEEQQRIIVSLQRNFFFVKQNVLSNAECLLIIETLKEMKGTCLSIEELKSVFDLSNDNYKSNDVCLKMINQIEQNNPNMDMNRFWNIYSRKQNEFIAITNGNALTSYIPEQIAISLNAILKQYSLLHITGTDGYRRLKKIAKIK